LILEHLLGGARKREVPALEMKNAIHCNGSKDSKVMNGDNGGDTQISNHAGYS
jgi:hypothetical protein